MKKAARICLGAAMLSSLILAGMLWVMGTGLRPEGSGEDVNRERIDKFIDAAGENKERLRDLFHAYDDQRKAHWEMQERVSGAMVGMSGVAVVISVLVGVGWWGLRSSK